MSLGIGNAQAQTVLAERQVVIVVPTTAIGLETVCREVDKFVDQYRVREHRSQELSCVVFHPLTAPRIARSAPSSVLACVARGDVLGSAIQPWGIATAASS